MKKYKKQICLIAAVCLLGTAAFCGYHIYDHYADEAEQTEAFENIAEIVEQAQSEDGNAPEVPLTEEENILTEYGELYLKNTDMVGWLSIAGTTLNYPVMQTPADPNYYLKHDFEKDFTDYGCPFMQADCDALAPSDYLRPQHEGWFDVRRSCQVPQQGFLADTQNRLVRYGAGQQRL